MDCSHLKEYAIQTVNCSWSTKREREDKKMIWDTFNKH